jgi:Protein of unknown function (DUF2877).
MTIQAISGDRNFLNMIGDGSFHGHVHSVFDHTINIQCALDSSLYSVAARRSDNAPNTIVIDTDCFAGLDIAQDSKVISGQTALEIAGCLSISARHACTWSGKLEIKLADLSSLKGNLAVARAYLDRYGIPGGMKPQTEGTDFQKAMSLMLASGSSAVIDALAERKIEQALEHAGKLLGLGPGLTPSGDDFLTGCLAVLSSVTATKKEFAAFCNGVEQAARRSTNLISYAALSKAARGEMRATIADLIKDLCCGQESSLEEALTKTVMIGSSSGTDIAWGVVRSLELLLETGE